MCGKAVLPPRVRSRDAVCLYLLSGVGRSCRGDAAGALVTRARSVLSCFGLLYSALLFRDLVLCDHILSL